MKSSLCCERPGPGGKDVGQGRHVCGHSELIVRVRPSAIRWAPAVFQHPIPVNAPGRPDQFTTSWRWNANFSCATWIGSVVNHWL